jgi:hypothetical protein
MDCLRIIDDMPGPIFLLLYGGVIWTTLATCRYLGPPTRRDKESANAPASERL